jgi:hypothetical protein
LIVFLGVRLEPSVRVIFRLQFVKNIVLDKVLPSHSRMVVHNRLGCFSCEGGPMKLMENCTGTPSSHFLEKLSNRESHSFEISSLALELGFMAGATEQNNQDTKTRFA